MRNRAACVELAHHGHRDGGRRGRRDGAEHERHDHRVPQWLMPREREPRADREQHEGNGEEGEHDRAGSEPCERDPALAPCVECQLRSGGEGDQRQGGVLDEAERVHFLASHEPEPRGADGETHEQVPGETRHARAPGELTAHVRGEEKEAQGQGRARLERSARGHVMKKGHHQAQREPDRDPAHGPQHIRRSALLTMRWSADIFP